MKKINKVWSTKVINLFNMLNEKKILLGCILGLMMLVGVLSVSALYGVVAEGIDSIEENSSIHFQRIEQKVDVVVAQQKVSEDRFLYELEERAIAAYTTKFKDLPLNETLIAKLDSSAQNTAILKAALRDDGIRTRFYNMDMKRILFIEAYYRGEL